MQSSSTTSLLPSSSSSSRFSSKRWEASFGKLSSSYGFGAPIPSLPSKSKRDKTVTSPVFVPNQSNRPLSPKPEKDFEAAFGALSSSYGFAGGVPSKPSRSTKTSKPSSSLSSEPTSHQQSTRGQPKDYQSAFGDLSSSYGFGGACSPSWVPRK